MTYRCSPLTKPSSRLLSRRSHESPFLPCLCAHVARMSPNASLADNALFYQSAHSTPPRRPNAGVSRRNSLTLPTLSRMQTESSTTTVCPSFHHGAGGNTSSFWPRHKPAIDFDDREKLATHESRCLAKESMKLWEGWRLVLFGSCGSMAFFIRYKISNVPQGLTSSSSSFQFP